MTEKYIDFPISASESLSEIEFKARELTEDKAYKIRFTSKLHTRGALGIEASILQMLGTWIQKNKHKKIFHSYQDGKPEDFEGLCSAIYGIAALSMVDEVWDSSGELLPKGLTLSAAKSTVEALRKGDFSNSFKSKYFGVPYIKTPRYDKEFDMPFYNGPNVIQADAFYRVIEKILSNKIGGYSRFESLKDMIEIEDLSDVLWELFKNTHDHGRCDKNMNLLPKNFRTVIIQQQDLDSKYFDLWCGKDASSPQKAFSKYWKKKNLDKYYFLDLSVVDFGVGFVELAREKADISSNKEILLKCLESGWSRLPEKSRGDGLTKVLYSVQKYNGWLRIRTGNLSIEKTFIEDSSLKININDIQEMPSHVAGTSVHISFPLEGFKGGDA